MKKILVLLSVFLLLPLTVQASDSSLLQEKLAKFLQINAQFTQVVINQEGKVLNESTGQLSTSRPGKFRWQVVTPEEELIVSDGKTMWLYSPFIEQVTLLNLDDAIAGTPFLLLSGANEQQWNRYSVKKEANRFTVKDKNPNSADNIFIFEFNDVGNISKFIIIDEQQQRSEFSLTHSMLTQYLTDDYFEFKIPAGVDIDDQR